jgi:uncharacterized protein
LLRCTPTPPIVATFDLNRAAKLGRELTRSIGKARRTWLLDEVTGISGWTETLKYLRDNTEFENDTVVCTGSSWDENAQVERDLLAGIARDREAQPLALSLHSRQE